MLSRRDTLKTMAAGALSLLGIDSVGRKVAASTDEACLTGDTKVATPNGYVAVEEFIINLKSIEISQYVKLYLKHSDPPHQNYHFWTKCTLVNDLENNIILYQEKYNDKISNYHVVAFGDRIDKLDFVGTQFCWAHGRLDFYKINEDFCYLRSISVEYLDHTGIHGTNNKCHKYNFCVFDPIAAGYTIV